MTYLPLPARIALRFCVCALVFMFMLSCKDSQPRADVRPDAPGSPAAIAAAHDCWNDSNPHPIPGHVVLQVTRGKGVSGFTFYSGRKATGLALENIGESFRAGFGFDGKEKQVSVTALYFCR